MKKAICLALTVGLGSAAAAPAAPPTNFHPGAPVEVYVAPGHATTLQLQTEQRIAAISLASPVVAYQYDKALNQLELTPAAQSRRHRNQP